MNIKFLTSVLLTTVDSVGMAISVLAIPVVLVGRVTGSINVRAYPSRQANLPSYGLVGDLVEVIEQREGRDGYIWYCVQFPSVTTGWIRSIW